MVTGPKQYEICEVPIPQPKPGEVLVKMMSAGVCGSDFHLFLGENPNAVYPRVPGHENAGIVQQLGEGVSDFKIDEHVVLDLVVACGYCPQCLAGRRNICRTVKSRGSAIDGGWREYICVPAHELYHVPKSICWEDAALIEPFAIGGHCTKRAQVKPSDTVLVLGTGTIGAIILQECKSIGCTVICADVVNSSLQRATSYGADYTINTREENLVEAIQKCTNGNGADVIFDSACFHNSLSMLIQVGIPTNGATIVPLGFCAEFENISQAMINTRELSIIGTRMSCGQFEPTIAKMQAGNYTTQGIVSEYIPFSNVGKVFDNILNPPKDMKKMVIMFE